MAAWLTISALAAASQAAPPDPAREDTGVADERARQRTRERWLVAAEGGVNAPVDAGFRATVDTPIRLRLLGAYGWIPTATFSTIASALASDARAESILDDIDFTGHVWRLGAGVRPWRRLGLYLDGGYARATLDASLALAATDIPELRLVGGEASMNTELDLWFVELGYQAQFLERIVLAGGVGMLGTIDSSTSVAATNGLARGVIRELASDVDDAFESYGFVPTLSLRLGVDLI